MNRILYIGGFELPDKNAAAQRVVANAMLLRDIGYTVSLVGLIHEDKETRFTYNGLSCRCIIYPKTIREWLYHILFFLPRKEIIMYEPSYVVLYNFPAIASLKILRYCQKRGIKVVHDITEWEQTDGWMPRDMIKRIDTWLRMHYCIKKSNGVIAISRYLYDYYKDSVKSILVPPLVDLQSSKWYRNRELYSGNNITLVYAGSPGGGSKDRLDIIVNALRKQNKLKLYVVGVTKEQFLNKFGKHVQLENIDNVVFKGRLTHEEALKTVCHADFQMLIRNHSRKNDAGFPTKLVESLSCGVPVIATPFSNILDYVKDGKNGLIIEDSQSLENIFDKVVKMTTKDIVSMKKACLEIMDFDYRQYKMVFEELFV